MKISRDELRQLKETVDENLEVDAKGNLIYSPYAKCFCGSGKKYKFCHKLKSYNKNEIFKLTTLDNQHSECLIAEELKSECDSKPIKSHSVSKSGMLKKIAEENKVYTTIEKNIFVIEKEQGGFPQKKISIQRASTFKGFCRKHDSELFAPFEDILYKYSPEQNFLLFYRAICLELYKTRNVLDMKSKVLNNCSFSDDLITNIEKVKSLVVDISYTKIGCHEIEAVKNKLDGQLVSRDFSHIKTYFIKIKEIPEIMFAGSLTVEFDFDGNRLLHLNQEEPIENYLNVNSIIDFEGNGVFVFNWLNNDDKYPEKFIESLNNLNSDELPNRLVRFLFEYNENCYCKISWWDNLSEEMKNELISSIKNVGLVDRKADDLRAKKLKVVDWTILERGYL